MKVRDASQSFDALRSLASINVSCVATHSVMNWSTCTSICTVI
jgi:hypothetical protein